MGAQEHQSQNKDLGKGVLTQLVEGDCACNLEGHMEVVVGMDTLLDIVETHRENLKVVGEYRSKCPGSGTEGKLVTLWLPLAYALLQKGGLLASVGEL